MMIKKHVRTILAAIAGAVLLSFPVYAAEDTSTEGPGIELAEPVNDSNIEETAAYEKGHSLGMFTTTGYCNCSKCSKGFNLTYSGTTPKADYTISANADVFPIGTKVMIDGIVYTVEDIGAHGNSIDIYYGSHQAALNHGMKTQEVFAFE